LLVAARSNSGRTPICLVRLPGPHDQARSRSARQPGGRSM